MNENGGNPPSRNGSILPPVITRRTGYRLPSTTSAAPIAPPFVAGAKPKSIVPKPVEEPAPPEPVFEATAEPEDAEAMAWDPMSDEGVVEPVFEADTDAVLQELTQHAAETSTREDFPLEAFIVPEQTQHVPSGLEGKPVTAQRDATPLTALADRLEKLSHKLRVEDTNAIIRRLAAGDRLDTMLAGLLAGYLAGSGDDS